jgi:hypothetical protein
MIIYSRPLYGGPAASNRPWPRTVLCEVSRSGASDWTLVYDDGSHVIIHGRAQLELYDDRLTSLHLQSYYLLSRKA